MATEAVALQLGSANMDATTSGVNRRRPRSLITEKQKRQAIAGLPFR
jgi:hypothetical protein